ncbi:MAG: hypothetical protein QOJ23_3195, partial [Actinomycetota bacterium]|nr:hypothetical protein [Actinomycetota bacterium]
RIVRVCEPGEDTESIRRSVMPAAPGSHPAGAGPSSRQRMPRSFSSGSSSSNIAGVTPSAAAISRHLHRSSASRVSLRTDRTRAFPPSVPELFHDLVGELASWLLARYLHRALQQANPRRRPDPPPLRRSLARPPGPAPAIPPGRRGREPSPPPSCPKLNRLPARRRKGGPLPGIVVLETGHEVRGHGWPVRARSGAPPGR